MRCHLLPLALLIAIGGTSCALCDEQRGQTSGQPSEPSSEGGVGGLPETVGFNEYIRPIFTKSCLACHGGPKQAAGVSFLYRDAVVSENGDEDRPIVPGDAAASLLIERVTEPDDDLRMPPPEHGPRLSVREVALLRKWIDQGAAWEEHWSFVAPRQSEPPRVGLTNWPRTKLDHFVLARLEAEGLTPSPAADRAAWLRRVTFDLIGLPPSAAQRAAFASDNRPDAFERVVDRLLASKHFGERWAAVWLDLARYADTMGYERDPPRDVWPYRDWLIRSLNADMPMDEFTIKQLAGDLLPDATVDDRLATAFHRNTQTNVEGGTDDEEFRIEAVIDRTNTTWQVWLGTTFGCAQCHDHPYDAVTNEEYYEFAALFNTSRDSDLDEDYPKLHVPLDAQQSEQAGELDRRISQLRKQLHAPRQAFAEDQGQWRRLAFDQLESTGNTQLRFEEDAAGGEIVADGTITARSRYTIAGPVPGEMSITALRIDALPHDVEQAIKNPEFGFVLSRLKLWVTEPGAEPREVFFTSAFSDDPEPIYSPSDSLRDNPQGWAAYSRIYKPRYAVFVLDEPLQLSADARLKLVWKHERAVGGQGTLVIRRARISVSSDPRWIEMQTSQATQDWENELAELKRQRDAIKSIAVPVMGERDPRHQRKSFMFLRGDWMTKTTEVRPGTPASLPRLAPESDATTRLDMARWVASPANPLTSRVLVNRVWAELFGVGLVETQEDFGAAGEPPSHPALLDDLAVRFSTTDAWRLKRLLRRLVLSATYRQSSHTPAELAQRDPRNRLLARGPRQRLTAEMVRDQALVLSGKFSPKQFGPPVMPYQPEGIWKTVYSGLRWETAQGEDRFRRALYTYWKRTSAYPSMMSFDMTSREVCTVRRITTNTPLQALVTLNDPAFIELTKSFAQRIAAEGGSALREQLAWAYREASGQRPTDRVLPLLERLHADALENYEKDPASAKALAETPDEFALVVVAGVIMNLDSVLTK